MKKITIMLMAALMAVAVSAQTLKVSVSKLDASGTIRGGAASKVFTVLNSGTGTSYYTVSDDAAWMTCSPTSGSSTNEGDQITVAFVTTNLTIGNYTGTITVTQTNAPITTKTIAVSLVVDDAISQGVVVGPAFALTDTSIAIGDRGTSLASSMAAGAAQIGPGVNSTANTLQFRDVKVVDTGYATCIVTNVGPGGVTNVITYLGKVSYP